MTYNFDPERWLDDRKASLEERFRRGELDDEELRRSLEELDRRYEEMLSRLDGTFQMPQR